MYYDNPHAKRVVDLTAQLWLPIPISFETVKVEELNRMIIESQPFVTTAIWSSTKARKWTRINGFNSSKMLTDLLLAGSSRMDILP
jgi:hypothetical protein